MPNNGVTINCTITLDQSSTVIVNESVAMAVASSEERLRQKMDDLKELVVASYHSLNERE